MLAMLAITYKPMKIKENKGSQMGHTKKIFEKKEKFYVVGVNNFTKFLSDL
jgi:chromosome condensin MukBEF ATPase and DNA-binding subunit MukB